ncbi:MAG: hypothetical protein C0512_12265 [Flavobacterium sp.]|nr:hypothetical protein [Flavobacterium sp.]
MFFSKLFQELPLVALNKQEKIHFVSRGFPFQSGLKVSGFKFQKFISFFLSVFKKTKIKIINFS